MVALLNYHMALTKKMWASRSQEINLCNACLISLNAATFQSIFSVRWWMATSILISIFLKQLTRTKMKQTQRWRQNICMEQMEPDPKFVNSSSKKQMRNPMWNGMMQTINSFSYLHPFKQKVIISIIIGFMFGLEAATW